MMRFVLLLAVDVFASIDETYALTYTILNLGVTLLLSFDLVIF